MAVFNLVVGGIKNTKMMLNDLVKYDLNFFQKIMILIDLSLSIIFYGTHVSDFFYFQFYKRKYLDRKSFIVHRKRFRIMKLCNDEKYREIFDEKPRFNHTFKHYHGLDWLDLSNCTLDDFNKFINRVAHFVIKPSYGNRGYGIKKISVDRIANSLSFYNKAREENVILEEAISQNNELAEFNPATVNTLKVYTLLGTNGVVRVMVASFKMGNGDRGADNLAQGGIAASIDIDSGLVVTPAIDKKLDRYIYHPLSGKQIIGFKIPYWEKVIITVQEIAQVIPEVRYVSWDLAIGQDGRVILIEGNYDAGQLIMQVSDQVGRWYHYVNAIKDLQE